MFRKFLVLSLILLASSCTKTSTTSSADGKPLPIYEKGWNAKISQINNANCYAATNGSDSNSGTSNTQPKQHIQNCIDNVATNDGDIIYVAPGTYNENIHFLPTAGISLIGSTSNPASTVIDGQQLDSVIKIQGTQGAPVKNYVIQGFTVQNGNAQQNTWYGGGISCLNAGLNLENMVIQDNIATYAGGIYISNDGSISNPDVGDISLDKVLIINNHAASHRGLYTAGGRYVTIKHTKVVSNTSISGTTNGGSGGAIFNTSGHLLIENSLFALNEVSAACGIVHGTGVTIFNSLSTAVVMNTTIANNNLSGFGYGVGLEVSTGSVTPSSVVLINSILWGNTGYPNMTSQIGFANNFSPSSTSETWIVNSDIQGGLSAIPADTNNIVHWLSGNISSDPLFVDTNSWQSGGFSIQQSSPALDTGVAQYTLTGTTYTAPSDDTDGSTRPLGVTHDMGAYEIVVPILKPTKPTIITATVPPFQKPHIKTITPHFTAHP